MTERSRLQWALELAARGFLIFPLRKGSKEPFGQRQFATMEHPEGRGWADIATSDAGQIMAWAEQFDDCNWGVCPGERYAIIDLDVKKDNGVQTWALLEITYGEVSTFTVDTPSGGRHHYFMVSTPAGNSHSFGDRSGIDVRGARGYVVGPGCALDHGGEYRVVKQVAPAAAPDWVRERLKPRAEKDDNRDKALFELDLPANVERAREMLKHRKPAVSGERGNDHTYATFQHVKDLGISLEKAVEIATEEGGWNDHCDPPWSHEEIVTIATNAYEYGQHAPGSKGGAMAAFAPEDKPEDTSKMVFEEPARGFSLDDITFRGSALMRREVRRELVIADWLLGHGVHAFIAERGKGKSTVLLDIACRIALDMDWHGVEIAKGWCVVYICGEDELGLANMMRAWQTMHKVKDLPEDRLVVMGSTVDLLSAEDTKRWTDHLIKVLGGRRAVIILDTWQRATSSGSQNEMEDMQVAVNHAEAMGRSLNGPIIGAFHPPKNSNKVTIMGSSVMENITSAIWHYYDVGSDRRLEVIRIKGAGLGNYQTFRYEKVKLMNDDGTPRLNNLGKEEISGALTVVGCGTTNPSTPEERAAEKANEIKSNESVRAAYAAAIRELGLCYESLTGSDTLENLTINRTAEAIESAWKIAKEGGDDPRVGAARRVVEPLRAANLEVAGKGKSTIRTVLTRCFKEDSRAHPFDDGYELRLTGGYGKSEHCFNVVQPVRA